MNRNTSEKNTRTQPQTRLAVVMPPAPATGCPASMPMDCRAAPPRSRALPPARQSGHGTRRLCRGPVSRPCWLAAPPEHSPCGPGRGRRDARRPHPRLSRPAASPVSARSPAEPAVRAPAMDRLRRAGWWRDLRTLAALTSSGSQAGSQRAATPGDAWAHPATDTPGESHAGPRPATPGDGRSVHGMQVLGFESP
jgi:hypothetical protein